VAASVLYANDAVGLDEKSKRDFFVQRANEMSVSFAPYGVAASLTIDEIIDPADTRLRIAEFLESCALDVGSPGASRLDEWPQWY
jgi:acetyl-CoA carboxylase carboxyltransferase component